MKYSKLIPALFLAIASFVTLNGQNATPSFQEFIAQFPKASLPYSFQAQDLQTQIETRPANKANRLSWEFYQYLPELERSAAYSNMPVVPEPVAVFETKEYTAVLYNLARGLARGNKSYSITVYTNKGEYIGTHFVAGVNPEGLTSVTIDATLSAEVQEYKLTWANDYRQNGPIGNKVTGLTLVETGKFFLATEGNPDQLIWASINAGSTANLAKMK
ncbi:MAG: hypothetical protein JNJ57_06280 [Saprospiraceae bacterium]|nr:hypothetical protein [Saprospiraceae bacterium]